MFIRRYSFVFLPILFAAILIGLPTKPQYFKAQNQAATLQETGLVAGRNVNMVSGTDPLTGDPYLQRQNEPSIAVSTRNPLHLLAGANDYRTVDMEIPAEELPGVQQGIATAPDAWLGVFKSFDGGESWTSKLLPGSLVDPSPASLSSPLHGYGAAADPTVRAGANGLFFYSGITFNRLQRGLGALFVSRFIDNNNKETGDPIQYLDTKILDVGNSGHFIDKPWLAVDVPRTTELITLSNGAVVPRANVFVVYTSFMGNTEGDVHGKLMITMSRDCGQTWDKPTQITDAGQPYQAATVALDPRNGKLYVAYRRFAKYGSTNAIMLLSEKDPKDVADVGYIHENLKFSKPVLVAEIAPFDQPTVETMFRTNTYPTMAIDNSGIVYLAWSQRDAFNYARIVVKTFNSVTGTWQGPFPVCANDVNVWGHQFMPSISYAAGKVTLAWYDQRYDIYDHPSYYIDDAPTNPLHTIDVRATQFDPGPSPVFPQSIQVSKYPWLLYVENNTLWAKQLLYFKPNLYLFLHGTRAFIGDYIDLSPSPPFVPDGNGWKYNTEPIQNPIFHATWADNRDVKESTNWIDFIHPVINGDPDCTQGGQAGIRNQNIYTSRLSRGIIAGSPGNTKPLNIKRAFVVQIKNTTENERNLNLTLTKDSSVTAKFQERGVESDSLDITVPPYSTMSTTVSVYPNGNIYASVTVNIFDKATGTLLAKVILNPDSTNPVIEDPDVDYPVPHVAAKDETHTPHVAAYQIIEWDYESANPHVAAPHVAANAAAANDDWVTPHVAAPHVAAPHVAAPHVAATNIINPHVAATNFSAADMTADSSLTDVYYGVDNVGNTTSSFSIGTLPVNLPDGIFVQMLIYRVYTTPSANGCQLVQQEHHELLSNITPHVAAVSPGGTSVNLKANNISLDIPVDATAVIPPGGRVIVMYRILDKNKYDNNKIDPTSFVPEIRQDAKDVINGQEQTVIPPPALVITTQSLNKGYIGLPSSQTLAAEGGYSPYTWSLVEKPSWMNINPSTGVISGTPIVPEGTFNVTVQVQDTPPANIQQQVTTKTYKITVAYPPDLIVESLTHSPASPNTTDEITFTAVVKNQGQGSAGPSTLELLVGGETPGANGTQFSVPALAPSATYTVQRKKTLGTAQGYTNTATADLNNVLPESNENNNITTDSFNVVAAGPIASKLAFDKQPVNTFVDSAIPSFTVKVLDSNGNLVPAATNEVSIAVNSGTGTLHGTLLKAAVNGIATFNDVSLDSAGAFTLKATSSNLTQAVSTSFNVISPPPLHPDQVNDITTGTSYGCGTTPGALFQSFKPGINPLTAVKLRLRAGGDFPLTGGMNSTIKIRADSPSGTVLGEAITYVHGPNPTEVFYYFPVPIEVTAGNTYVIEWTSIDGRLLTWMGYDANSPDSYPSGTSYGCTRIPEPGGRDFIFTTYTWLFGQVTDPAGDAYPWSNPPSPDLVSATGTVNGTNLVLNVQFAPGTFTTASSCAQFMLDTDCNPGTGHPGVNSGCQDDKTLLGSEFLVNMDFYNNSGQASLYKYLGTCNSFSWVGNFTITITANGMETNIPMALLSGDGRMNFKVVSYAALGGGGSTGVLDYMTDIGSPVGMIR
jgi:hypothetical protein